MNHKKLINLSGGPRVHDLRARTCFYAAFGLETFLPMFVVQNRSSIHPLLFVFEEATRSGPNRLTAWQKKCLYAKG